MQTEQQTNTINILIRTFVFPQDYPAVYQLWENAGNGIHLRHSDKPQEIKKKIERDPDLFILAELEEQIIGSVLGGFDGRRGMMYHLAVAEEYRQQGIASHLLEELEQRLRTKGCTRYYLLVTKNNQSAIHYYEKRGWQHMEDLFAYAKNLN